MTDYVIQQQGRTLTSSGAIKLVKYENKVSRLIFELDNTIPTDLRLYLACLNPQTKKYFYTPLVNNKVIIGSEISRYVGRWDTLLIGISPDTNIDIENDLDDNLIVWSSFTFKKIVVIDTFLSDDALTVTHPNIEKAMDDLMVLHDEVVNLAAQISDDSQKCEAAVEECNQILDDIKVIQQDVSSLQTALTNTYNSYMSQMRSAYNQYMADLRAERNGG